FLGVKYGQRRILVYHPIAPGWCQSAVEDKAAGGTGTLGLMSAIPVLLPGWALVSRGNASRVWRSTKTSVAMPATPRAAVKIRNGRMGIHWATASWSTTPATISTATKRYSSTEHQARHAPTMTKIGSTHRTYQG